MSNNKVDYRQTLPTSLRVLTDEQIGTLEKYQHSSAKSTYETFLNSGPCKWAEEKIPDILSANTVTIIGQIPLQVMVVVMFS